MPRPISTWSRRKVVSRTEHRPALNVRGSLWRLKLSCGHTVERTGGENGGTVKRAQCMRCRWPECFGR